MQKLILIILTLLSVACYSQTFIEPEMVLIQGGQVNMGDGAFHRITLEKYYIGKYEVTQKEWRSVMGNNPSKFSGEDLPVENVSWDDCQEFIKKLNQMTKKGYRLPTEAEWEFAAKGGKKCNGYESDGHFLYSGSNTYSDVAWTNDKSADAMTHPVGTKAPNELDIYDMSGNVFEWCNDLYIEYDRDRQSSSDVGKHVLRGGCYDGVTGNVFCLVTKRLRFDSGNKKNFIGLRLAMDHWYQ